MWKELRKEEGGSEGKGKLGRRGKKKREEDKDDSGGKGRTEGGK